MILPITVGFLRDIHLCSFEACQVLERETSAIRYWHYRWGIHRCLDVRDSDVDQQMQERRLTLLLVIDQVGRLWGLEDLNYLIFPNFNLFDKLQHAVCLIFFF